MSEQSAPISNAGPDIWQLVIDDMTARRQTGIDRYGTPLQPGNGRDVLRDLTEELLDAIAYLRQLREEDWRKRALAAEAVLRRLLRCHDNNVGDIYDIVRETRKLVTKEN